MSAITPNDILTALQSVDFESTGKSIVALDLVGRPRVEGSDVTIPLELPSPAYPREPELVERVRQAIGNLAAGRVEIVTSWRVREGDTRKARIPGIKNVLCVASGKGGVGKSTVASNLAVGLARLGPTVGLLDLDIYGPSGTVAMGIDSEPEIHDEGVLVPAEAHGVRFLSMGQLAPGDRPIVWRGPMLHKMVTQFIGSAWGELDYLVLDLPPGTGDVQLTVTQGVPVTGAVIVTTPQEIALIDARKGLTMFRDNQMPILGIVENMASYVCAGCGKVHSIFGENGGRDLAEAQDLPLLGRLPLDPAIAASGDGGRPAVLDEGPVGDAFRALVAETAAALGAASLERNPFRVLS